MTKCNVCPRNCNVDREKSHGFCLAPNKLIVSKIMLHQGEEPFLLSENDKGSGAIFFSGCNLRCVFCQNFSISHQINGKEITISNLVEIFKLLENKGAGNIDLVTPTHFSKQIIQALKTYKPKIPVIWNCGGYEKVETLKELENLVDIFLIDYKYANNELAGKYSNAKDYASNIELCFQEIKRQIPKNIFENGKLIKGVVIRHLVLPSLTKDSFLVLDNIKRFFSEDALVSIMSQFTPSGNCDKFPEINRTLTKLEYKSVVSHAKTLGFSNALVQDLQSATKDMIPDFENNIIEF